MVQPVLAAAGQLAEAGINLTVVNARCIKPLDHDLFENLAREHRRIATVEENVLAGGFGCAVEQLLATARVANPQSQVSGLLQVGLPDRFIEQGPRNWLLDEAGLSAAKLAVRFRAYFA